MFPGAYLLIDLLRSKTNKNINISSGKNVVIAGGGVRLPDAVNILKENRSKKITIILRENEDDSSLDQISIEKLSQAGANIIYNCGITKVMGEEEQLKSIEYIEFDTGVKNTIDTNTIIIGSGRFPELVFIPVKDDENDDSKENKEIGANTNIGPLVWEGVEMTKKPDSNRELGLFSNQDVISEYSSAVDSINGGRKAAAAIHNLMYGIKFQESLKFITPKTMLQDVSNLDNVDISPRNIMEPVKAKSVKAENDSQEQFSTGFAIETAHVEANRCLRCGLVCYEKSS